MSDALEEAMVQVETITKQIVLTIDTITEEQLDELIKARDQLISAIAQFGITEEQKRLYTGRVKALQEQNEMILHHMHQLKDEALHGKTKMTAVRRQKSAYETIITSEGYFFDRRK